MNQYSNFILRWLAWALLISFESVVGFPWLSLYLAGEWLLNSNGEIIVPGLFLMALIVSAVYGVSLTLSTVLMLGLWQLLLHTRSKSWQRWTAYGVGAIVIGTAAGIGLSWLTVGMSLISLFIFVKLSKGNFLKKPWRKTKQMPLSAV